eukprot:TRINITY_DN4009_c0_g1_i1.p1 TRINITY_DN4009_c0_g1~~TRINITY_DN4009_c0_g1_i1.p1  ORF type:complete len:179 (-),score=52.70 TRINITY_DN4009_c0_g1_i1:47-583(-)
MWQRASRLARLSSACRAVIPVVGLGIGASTAYFSGGMSFANSSDLIIVPDWNHFESELGNAAASTPADHYLLFYVYGARNPETGKSWCPDCVRADPIIYKAIEQARAAGAKFKVLELPVAREAYKGNPDFFYRKNAAVQLKAVPQLVRYDPATKSLKAVLIEEECFNEDNVLRFIRGQ